MKIKSKKKLVSIIFAVVLLLVFGWWAWCYFGYPAVPDTAGWRRYGLSLPDNKDYPSLVERATEAEKFAKNHHLSTHYALFVDYSVSSGTPRLYVWDFHKKQIIARKYVMHGPGKGSTAEKPVFSNMPGNNCSSLGRFIVTRHHGRTNKRGYRLRGMDVDSQTAFARGLMLHSSTWVDVNCWRKYIPLHAASCMGCVTISTKGQSYISSLVKSEENPILLWSYCSKNQ